MSMPAHDDPHEFVVSAELAEAAERLGVSLHAGDRVRLEVIEGDMSDDGPSRQEPWPPAWVDSIHTGETDLGVRARDILRAEFGKQ
jgi:hypothetical protein